MNSVLIINCQHNQNNGLFVRQFILLIFLLIPHSLFAVNATRSITKIGKNIYRFQNNAHYSVFLVENKSLLLTDPINRKAAQWLKTELKKRFGVLKVKYLIYSHNHKDHVSGGDVWATEDTQVIAHRDAAKNILINQVATAKPTITFTDELTIEFEGRQIDLKYYGRNNGVGNITMHLPEDKFLFAVDWVLLKRLPWKELYHYDLAGMMRSLEELLKTVDFETVSPGHSVIGTKEDLMEFYQYLVDLTSAVQQGINANKNLATLQDEIKLSKYSHFAMYKEWRRDNIKGAYEQLLRVSGKHGQVK